MMFSIAFFDRKTPCATDAPIQVDVIYFFSRELFGFFDQEVQFALNQVFFLGRKTICMLAIQK